MTKFRIFIALTRRIYLNFCAEGDFLSSLKGSSLLFYLTWFTTKLVYTTVIVLPQMMVFALKISMKFWYNSKHNVQMSSWPTQALIGVFLENQESDVIAYLSESYFPECACIASILTFRVRKITHSLGSLEREIKQNSLFTPVNGVYIDGVAGQFQNVYFSYTHHTGV